MQYDKIKTRPVQFVSITNLKVEDFDYLLSNFREEWDEYNEFFTIEGKPCQRKSRVNSILPKVADKLMYLLIFLKQIHSKSIMQQVLE